MIKHTHSPGPWRVSLADDTVVIDARGNEVAAIDGDYNQPETWPVMEENARLIAAAPEMFVEIEKQIAWLNHIRPRLAGNVPGSVLMGVDQSIKYLGAALAKARGEG